MATLCRLDVFLLFTFLNIISNSRYNGIVKYPLASDWLAMDCFYL